MFALLRPCAASKDPQRKRFRKIPKWCLEKTKVLFEYDSNNEKNNFVSVRHLHGGGYKPQSRSPTASTRNKRSRLHDIRRSTSNFYLIWNSRRRIFGSNVAVFKKVCTYFCPKLFTFNFKKMSFVFFLLVCLSRANSFVP